VTKCLLCDDPAPSCLLVWWCPCYDDTLQVCQSAPVCRSCLYAFGDQYGRCVFCGQHRYWLGADPGGRVQLTDPWLE
jgi:hypothetical protein